MMISTENTNENEVRGLFALINILTRSSNPPPISFPIALDKAWARPQTPTKVPATSGSVKSSISERALLVPIPADNPKIAITKNNIIKGHFTDYHCLRPFSDHYNINMEIYNLN